VCSSDLMNLMNIRREHVRIPDMRVCGSSSSGNDPTPGSNMENMKG